MAQFNYDHIIAAGTSGIRLSQILNEWMDAERSGHSGTAAQARYQTGKIWFQTGNARAGRVYMKGDGTNQVPLHIVDLIANRPRSVIDADLDSGWQSSRDDESEYISSNTRAFSVNGKGIAFGSQEAAFTIDARGRTDAFVLPTNSNGSGFVAGALAWDGTRMRAGTGVGTSKQIAYTEDVTGISPVNTALNALTPAANRVPYFTGASSASLLEFSRDATFSTNSDDAVVSEKAIRARIETAKPQRGTAQSPSAGKTPITWTGIPSGVRRIEIALDQLHYSHTLSVQIGDSGGIETSGYVSRQERGNDGSVGRTDGFSLPSDTLGQTIRAVGVITLLNLSGNTWVASGLMFDYDGGPLYMAGSKTLSAELTQLRLAFPTSAGDFITPTGSANVIWE